MSKTRDASYKILVGSGAQKTWQRRIYAAYKKAEPPTPGPGGGLTIDEVIVMFGPTKGTTIQPRVTELYNLGLIYKTTRTRLSRAKREVTVYRIKKYPKPPKRKRCGECNRPLPR